MSATGHEGATELAQGEVAAEVAAAQGPTDEVGDPAISGHELAEEALATEEAGEAGEPDGQEVVEAAYPPDFIEPASYVPLRFVDVVMVLPSLNPIVVLEEEAGAHRRLSIPIGQAEGAAIAYAARRITTPKPLTHELVVNMMTEFALVLEVVRITEVNGAAYAAEAVVSGPSGTRVIACRPSDGIALALRYPLFAPLVAHESVLRHAESLGGGGGTT